MFIFLLPSQKEFLSFSATQMKEQDISQNSHESFFALFPIMFFWIPD